MVRTRANNAAVRKGGYLLHVYNVSVELLTLSAVVAKAPRKNLVSGRTSTVSPASGKGKGKAGGTGNPLKRWPIPKGQKGLQGFLRGGDGGCGSSAAGSSSMEGSCEHSEEEEFADTDSAQNNSLVNLEDITQLNSDSEQD